MKKQSVLNLIKYYCERNDSAFRAEAMYIARYLDSIYSIIWIHYMFNHRI